MVQPGGFAALLLHTTLEPIVRPIASSPPDCVQRFTLREPASTNPATSGMHCARHLRPSPRYENADENEFETPRGHRLSPWVSRRVVLFS